MSLAQRFLKIAGQCYLCSSTDAIYFPAPADFIIRAHPQTEKYPRDTYGLNVFTHPRQWYYEGEVKIAEYDDNFLSSMADWDRAGSTGGIGFAEMEEHTVAGGTITLSNVPIDGTVHIINPATRVAYVQGLATASPNVYTRAGAAVTLHATTPDGTVLKCCYFYVGATVSRINADPYNVPSGFTLYAAQAIVWPATGTPYWGTVYARSCVITDPIETFAKETTVKFAVNNVVTNDLYMDRPKITE